MLGRPEGGAVGGRSMRAEVGSSGRIIAQADGSGRRGRGRGVRERVGSRALYTQGSKTGIWTM